MISKGLGGGDWRGAAGGLFVAARFGEDFGRGGGPGGPGNPESRHCRRDTLQLSTLALAETAAAAGVGTPFGIAVRVVPGTCGGSALEPVAVAAPFGTGSLAARFLLLGIAIGGK
jgi:hypothetical protein